MALEHEDTVRISTEVQAEEVADAIADCGQDIALEVVQHIDDRVADWDFTLALCDYFDEQRKKFEAEQSAVKEG